MNKPSHPEYIRIGESELHAPSFKHKTKKQFFEMYTGLVTWDLDNAWERLHEKNKELDREKAERESKKGFTFNTEPVESFQEKLSNELVKKDASPDKGRKKRPKA